MNAPTPDNAPLAAGELVASTAKSLPVTVFEVSAEPSNGGDPEHPLKAMRFPEAKRALDVVGAATLLLVTAPLLVVIGALIKLDSPGPVIYSQERVGLNRRRRQRRAETIPVSRDLRRGERRQNHGEGQPFFIYKFRTMHADAENGGPCWAQKDDPRSTRVGRLLRVARLDELPQLWNVLRGEMSLVGPRPERPHFVMTFARQIPGYRHRLFAPPGITGLAQVEHRYDSSEDDVRRKLDYDLDYLTNYSLGRDLRILLKTVIVMLTGKGAH